MVYDIPNQSDIEVLEVFLKEKGIEFTAYENEQKLMIHNEVMFKLESYEDENSTRADSLMANVREVVEELYREESDSIDSCVSHIADCYLVRELYYKNAS